MNSIGDWVTVVLGFVASILLFNFQQSRKKLDETAKECQQRDAMLAERIARLEAELMTEREVREIMQAALMPVLDKLDRMAGDVQDIKVNIAKLPKRMTDKGDK